MKKQKKLLPKNAKRVFKGKKYSVWQWKQELYDGSTKIFEKIKKLQNEAEVIAIVDKKILIQIQKQPHRDAFISLPGGTCENKETPLECAKRELLEETGIKTSNLKLWKTIHSPYSSIIRKSHYFIAKNCIKIQKLNLDNGEKIENKLISIDDFLLLSDNDNFRNTDLINTMLRIRINPKEKKKFQSLLFS